jgi:uncharacterized protein (TIGR02271 family)
MAQTVIGVFDNATEAQQAVEELISRGFSRDRIDVSVRNTSTDTTTTHTDEHEHEHESGIGKFFSSLFGSDDDDDTRKYTTVASRGSVVTVHAQSDDEAARAADILDDAGAVDVDERAAQYGYTAASTGTTTGSTLENQVRDFGTDDTGLTAKVIEENLQVGKRTVETGGARLRSRIVERPVEESVRLRQERVTVQRTPVNRPATEADFANFKEGQIEVVEHAEVPVVAKEARVVEEVSLGKQVEERQETIRDTVRSTEVEVENLTNTTNTTTSGTTGTTRTTDLDDDTDLTRRGSGTTGY